MFLFLVAGTSDTSHTGTTLVSRFNLLKDFTLHHKHWSDVNSQPSIWVPRVSLFVNVILTIKESPPVKKKK